MPARDTLLVLRDPATDSLLDQDETIVYKLRTTPVEGLSLQIICPIADGTAPQLDITIRASDSSDPDATEAIAAHPQITAAGEYYIPFTTDKDYIEVFLDVTGTGTDFGLATVTIVPKWREWDRLKHFEA